jgi:hypothetical protein
VGVGGRLGRALLSRRQPHEPRRAVGHLAPHWGRPVGRTGLCPALRRCLCHSLPSHVSCPCGACVANGRIRECVGCAVGVEVERLARMQERSGSDLSWQDRQFGKIPGRINAQWCARECGVSGRRCCTQVYLHTKVCMWGTNLAQHDTTKGFPGEGPDSDLTVTTVNVTSSNNVCPLFEQGQELHRDFVFLREHKIKKDKVNNAYHRLRKSKFASRRSPAGSTDKGGGHCRDGSCLERATHSAHAGQRRAALQVHHSRCEHGPRLAASRVILRAGRMPGAYP